MKFLYTLMVGVLTIVLAGPVTAQTVGVGTTAKGATSQVSAAIAKVTSQFSGLQMHPTPMAGTQKYIPAVNSGSLEFGVANIMQTAWAITRISGKRAWSSANHRRPQRAHVSSRTTRSSARHVNQSHRHTPNASTGLQHACTITRHPSGRGGHRTQLPTRV